MQHLATWQQCRDSVLLAGVPQHGPFRYTTAYHTAVLLPALQISGVLVKLEARSSDHALLT